MLKKIKIQIAGLHCQSCKTIIETEVDVLPGVKDVNVDYPSGKCQIEYNEQKISPAKMFAAIEKLGYKVNQEAVTKKNSSKNKYRNYIIAGALVILFAIGYLIIKELGLLEILSRLNEERLGYGLIFLIGLLASFHCVGMCGGLIVTYSAKQPTKKDKKFSFSGAHLQYNLGRLISYTTIGAILGGFGSFFAINPTFTGTITLVAGVFMVLMGLSLTTKHKWLEKIKLRTPAFIAHFLFNQRHNKKPKEPFVIGLLNGFMPCGPLQAMQLYALASGSIVNGALSMGFYALGTIPLLFGFGSFISLISQEHVKKVMKFSGIIVIALGIIMFNRGLTNFGYGFSGLIPSKQLSEKEYLVSGDVKEYQVANMELSYSGYSPNVLYVKKGIPVRWVINVKQMSGCTDEIIMPEYNIDKKLQKGENVIEFVPQEAGELKFSCWMQMVWGKFIVVDEGEELPAANNLSAEEVDESSSSSCSGDGECGGSCGSTSCGCGSRISTE